MRLIAWNAAASKEWLAVVALVCTGCSAEGSPSSALASTQTNVRSTAALNAVSVGARLENVMEPDTTNDGSFFYNFAQSVAIDGNVAVVGQDADFVGANQEQGSAYIYVFEEGRWTERQKLTASDGGAHERFGGKVAISGDTIVIGAPWEHAVEGDNRGAVYIYQRDGATWTERQKLVRDEIGSPAEFGRVVAFAEDTLVVAASVPSNAYVYVRQGGTFTEQQQLTPRRDGFGSSLSVDGDTMLIGAPGVSTGTGAVYVFVRSGTTWVEHRELSPAGMESTSFGGTLALSGDTALVGAPDENGADGAVYAYVRDVTDWTLQEKIAGYGHRSFGCAVAVDGDTAVFVEHDQQYWYNFYVSERSGSSWGHKYFIQRGGAQLTSDQTPAAVSGDVLLVNGAEAQRGHAEIHLRTQGTWAVQQALTTRDGIAGQHLGVSVSIDGTSAAVGAFGQGVVYTYERSGSEWRESQRLISNDGIGGGAFGQAVAISGDGLAVGAPDENAVYVHRRTAGSWKLEQAIHGAASGASNLGAAVAMQGDVVAVAGSTVDSTMPQGAVYIYQWNGTTWAPQALLVSDATSDIENFGASLALSGDTLLVAGEPQSRPYGERVEGAAYVYVREGANWKLQQKLTSSDGPELDFFGGKVALSGDTALVSADLELTASAVRGAAYVFVRQGKTWTEQQKLVPTEPAPKIAYFGAAVSLLGDTAVVSGGGDGPLAEPSRSGVYIFTRSGTTWTQQLVLLARDDEVNDGFGAATALSGNQLVIGAPWTAGPPPYGEPEEGTAYFYGLSGTRVVSCALGDDCASGHCVDGFCCDMACNGDCEWCGDPSAPGICKAAPSGAPRGERACAGSGVCAGQCDGTQRDACVPAAKATECAPATCDGDDRIAAGTCDGAGNCTAGTRENCGDYTCASTTSECKRVCSGDADCRAGFVCVGGSCSPRVDGGPGNDSGPELDGAAGTGGMPSGDAETPEASGGNATDAGSTPAGIGRAAADDGGCGCRVVSPQRHGRSPALLAIGILLALRRGRMRKAWLALAAILCAGCSAEGPPSSAAVGSALNTPAVRATLENVLAPKTTNDGPVAYGFATSVAIDGNIAVVGQSMDVVGANQQQGSAYVYLFENGQWVEHQKLTASDGETQENYGASVALGGTTIAIGASWEYAVRGHSRGAVYVYEREGAIWTERQKLVRDDLWEPGDFGRSVAVAENTLVVGALYPPSAYVYVREGETFIEQQKLTVPDDGSFDDFGSSVSVDGDTVLIGAPDASDSAGSVHVFVRSGTTWTEQQELTPTVGTGRAGFGGTVALSGDTAAVSASGEGAVYFYVRDPSHWTLQQKMIEPTEGENFGLQVALDGNTAVALGSAPSSEHSFRVFERSGASWSQRYSISRRGDYFAVYTWAALSGDVLLVVGAEEGRGHAETHVRTQGSWALQQPLTTKDGLGYQGLGMSVAIDGDSAAVTTSGQDVYTYERSGSQWLESQRIIPGEGIRDEGFHQAVALSGDRLVVGASGKNAAYTYRRTAASWTLEQAIYGAASSANRLGAAVAMQGDVLAVTGSIGDSTEPPGGVYVYGWNGTFWVPRALLVSNGGDDNFGVAVALSGDTLLVGADSAPIGRSSYSPGAAYVYVRDGASWRFQQKLSASDGRQADFFGRRVALSGDTALVTASNAPTTSALPGAAYVFVRQGTTWTEQQKLVPAEPALPDSYFYFASEVSLLGDTALVSAGAPPLPDPGRSRVYVFTRRGTTWTEQLTLLSKDDYAKDAFGFATAISGDQLLIGAPLEAGPAPYGKPQEGRAYFYGLSGLRGSSCALGDDCASGHCVDGVCCDRACDGQCEWCGDPTAPGVCQAAPAPCDPSADGGVEGGDGGGDVNEGGDASDGGPETSGDADATGAGGSTEGGGVDAGDGAANPDSGKDAAGGVAQDSGSLPTGIGQAPADDGGCGCRVAGIDPKSRVPGSLLAGLMLLRILRARRGCWLSFRRGISRDRTPRARGATMGAE